MTSQLRDPPGVARGEPDGPQGVGAQTRRHGRRGDRPPLAISAGRMLAYRAIALWVPAVVGGLAFLALRRTLREEAAQIAVCAPQQEIEVIGLGRVRIGAEP